MYVVRPSPGSHVLTRQPADDGIFLLIWSSVRSVPFLARRFHQLTLTRDGTGRDQRRHHFRIGPLAAAVRQIHDRGINHR